MSTIEVTRERDETSAAVSAATAGDESAFTALARRYRPELQLHCYRMVGSYEDSEDLVQETFLRAWRRRETFAGRSTFRAWLYGIATNAALNALAKDPRRARVRPGAGANATEAPWLTPYPDRLIEEIPTREDEPDAHAVSRETVELAFLVAIQHLPPRQRAVLILRDVLDWPARDTAGLIGASVASVNSALQRARTTLRERLPERRLEWSPGADPSREERALLERYLDATERADAEAFVAMMRDDARFSMPPQPELLVGARRVVDAWVAGGFGSKEFGDLRGVVTRANGQPAVACYRRLQDDTAYRPLALDVLRIEGGAIAEILAFPLSPVVLRSFGLPPVL